MHICSPTALMDQLYTPHNAVLAWDITLSIETHFKSLSSFITSCLPPHTPQLQGTLGEHFHHCLQSHERLPPGLRVCHPIPNKNT